MRSQADVLLPHADMLNQQAMLESGWTDNPNYTHFSGRHVLPLALEI